MKRLVFFTMTGIFLLSAAALLGGEVLAQQSAKTFKEQFVGTWTLVELFYTTPNGARVDSFGTNPKGRLRFDGDGTYTLQIMRSDLPKFASKNRMEGTAEENKAVVQGTMSYYGTYSVSEPDQILAVHLDACSFPNFDGADQKRPFTLNGGILTFTNKDSSVAGMSVQQTWKQIK